MLRRGAILVLRGALALPHKWDADLSEEERIGSTESLAAINA